MIVKEKIGNVELSSDIAPSNFKIKASRQAFAILSAGIYSDKISSIIRELSTNACDSHVQAGKSDKPFYVHLPSSLEPWFAVRDNGVGMSPEQIQSIYTTYFESNKTTSNDVTGCLGLGSKSPFSYTDQFNVESRYNGIKAIYNCFVDASGVPTIAKLGESETDECNGVEIKFPVKREDFWEFTQKAQNILIWFKVKPIVTGDSNFAYPEKENYIETEKYSLRKNSDYKSSHIVMGNVAYPLDIYDLQGVSKVLFSETEKAILNWGIDIYLPIGTVDITANREKVNYDQTTFNAVKDIVDEAIQDIKKEVEDKITNCKNVWEARKALYEIRHSILGRVKDMVKFNWNGIEISDNINIHDVWRQFAKEKEKEFIDAGTLDADILDKMSKGFWEGSMSQREFWEKICPKFELANLTPTRKDTYRRHVISTLSADNTPILFNDLKHGGLSRVTNYCRTNNLDHAYMLGGLNEKQLEVLGLKDYIILASSMPKPTRTKSGNTAIRKRSVKATLNEFVNASGEASNYWKPAEVEADEGGVYIEMSYYKIANKQNVFCHPEQLHKLKAALQILTEDDTAIYGIRPNDVEKIKKHSEEWVNVHDYVKEIVELNDSLEEKLQLAYNWDNYAHSNISVFFNYTFSPMSSFGKYVKVCKEAFEASRDSKVQAYKKLKEFCGMKSDLLDDNSISALETKTYTKYPMISTISWYGLRDHAKEIYQYVNDMDSLEMYKSLEKLKGEVA